MARLRATTGRSFKGGCRGVNRCGSVKAVLAESGRRAIPTLMPDERAILAISRIERALARIEASAGRTTAPPADGGEIEQLRQAHQALRGRVEGAITHIDQLLASREERADG